MARALTSVACCLVLVAALAGCTGVAAPPVPWPGPPAPPYEPPAAPPNIPPTPPPDVGPVEPPPATVEAALAAIEIGKAPPSGGQAGPGTVRWFIGDWMVHATVNAAGVVTGKGVARVESNDAP